MAITSKTLDQLVSDAATAIQGAASALVDMTAGSLLRAFMQAVGGVGMWLQAIALQIAARTRLSTSDDDDADSWVADFGVTRLAAVAATGVVTFSRLTSTTSAVVPVATVVQTSDGAQTYAVVADTDQPAYSAADGGYVLAIGVSSIAASVQAQTAAAAGNVVAGAINTIGSTIAGIDGVTNPAAFTNGSDAESTPALRTRFVSEINNLSKATVSAVGAAIEDLEVGIDYTITENQAYDGTAEPGYFYVVTDDGSGAPSDTFISTVSNAVDRVRAITSTFGVFPPVVVTANVAMTVTIASGYQAGTVTAAVDAALQTFVNTLGLGTSLPYSRLSQVAYDASPGVSNVKGVTLNGGTADLAATAKQVIKAGTITSTAG